MKTDKLLDILVSEHILLSELISIGPRSLIKIYRKDDSQMAYYIRKLNERIDRLVNYLNLEEVTVPAKPSETIIRKKEKK